jgi:hypothetical protein
MKQNLVRTLVAAWLALALTACASVRSVTPWPQENAPSPSSEKASRNGRDDSDAASERRASRERERLARERENLLRERAELRAKLRATPIGARAGSKASAPIRAAALRDRGLRVVVSTEERALWLMRDSTVIDVFPIAVGMHQPFTWAGKTYDFKTPHSRRKVLAKGLNPIWVPPDWHYFEKAAADHLTPVHLKIGDVVRLQDSTRIEVRGDQVGRVNIFGNWWPFTPGSEIIFDSKIFIPPIGTAQRKVPDILGTHKLEIGEGYLIHGTNQDTSVGEAVSHGCVRMFNEDVARLYSTVPVGTPVYIF